MNIIVAVDREWGIGNNGRLLAAIREDLRNFAKITKGKTVVYGSKTLKTFPDRAPLKNRRNIVMTRQKDLKIKDAETAGSLEEVLSLIADEDPDNVFIIGGASVYKQFLPLCDCCYVTKIEASFEKDAYFDDIDADDAWRLVYRSRERKSDKNLDGTDEISFFFTKYRRIGNAKD